MESDRSWEQNTLINELIQGMEIARKLKADLNLPSSGDTRDSLVQRILSSYDKALLILRQNASVSKSQAMHQATKTSSPESPVISPPREDVEGGLNDRQKRKLDSKKRKMMPKWMDKVQVKIEDGFEGPQDDGYNWRKYGQKDILGAKYPRSYYRCTFRNTKDCWATKQVQRSNEDSTIFDITYRGKHTCSQQKSSDTEEKPHAAQLSQESLTITHYNLVGNDEMAYPFTSFGCMTQDDHTLLPSVLDETDPFLSSLSQMHLLSPETPESNNFLSPSFVIDELHGVYTKPGPDSDVSDIIIPANTSATDSPILDFNFSLDALKIDSIFPFNASGEKFSPNCT